MSDCKEKIKYQLIYLLFDDDSAYTEQAATIGGNNPVAFSYAGSVEHIQAPYYIEGDNLAPETFFGAWHGSSCGACACLPGTLFVQGIYFFPCGEGIGEGQTPFEGI